MTEKQKITNAYRLMWWFSIPIAIFTAWGFSWVTSWFDVSYPAYINWLVGYISVEADWIKLNSWRLHRGG